MSEEMPEEIYSYYDRVYAGHGDVAEYFVWSTYRKDYRTKYIRANSVDVDVEKLKRSKKDEDFMRSNHAAGWNDCIDYLLEQGIIRGK